MDRLAFVASLLLSGCGGSPDPGQAEEPPADVLLEHTEHTDADKARKRILREAETELRWGDPWRASEMIQDTLFSSQDEHYISVNDEIARALKDQQPQTRFAITPLDLVLDLWHSSPAMEVDPAGVVTLRFGPHHRLTLAPPTPTATFDFDDVLAPAVRVSYRVAELQSEASLDGVLTVSDRRWSIRCHDDAPGGVHEPRWCLVVLAGIRSGSP